MSSMLDVLPVETAPRWEASTAQPKLSVAEQIAPALARLDLGGELTGDDRELLDRMAPHNCLTFLVSDGVWLHPDNVPLFDYSIIDSLVTQCGSAVMTHHYRPRPGMSESYAVQTAIVNPGWEQPLVVGLFGPFAQHGDNSRREQFEQLVSDFRTGYQIGTVAARRVRSELARTEPVLVVTPADGRIVTCNDSAARALEITPSEAVGLHYREIAHLLEGGTTTTRLESGPIDFSLIRTSPPAAMPRAEAPTAPAAEPDLAGAFREMFAAIKALEEVTRASRDSVSAGVMHAIHNQAEVLRSRLTHLTGVADDD